MPSLATAGHGALIAMELDPTGAPGTFTTIAELNGDITEPGLSRPETDVTGHNNNIDHYIFGVLQREPVTFSLNWIFDHETHDHETGLKAKIIDNEIFGLRMSGPGGTLPVIMSGAVTNISGPMNPVREGARTTDVTFRASGPMKIGSVIIGEDTV